MKKNKLWIGVLLIPFILSGLFLWAAVERTAWDEDFVTEDKEVGSAHFTSYDWRFWGSPHALSFGGGSIYSSATFRVGNHHCRWSSTRNERVFAIQCHRGRWLALSCDRTDAKTSIRFYQTNNGGMLTEIVPQDYPLRLAIQNLWLDDHDIKTLSAFDPQDSWSQRSLTARSWWKIVHWQDLEQVDQAFIEQIMAKQFPGRTSFMPPKSERPPLKQW